MAYPTHLLGRKAVWLVEWSHGKEGKDIPRVAHVAQRVSAIVVTIERTTRTRTSTDCRSGSVHSPDRLGAALSASRRVDRQGGRQATTFNSRAVSTDKRRADTGRA